MKMWTSQRTAKCFFSSLLNFLFLGASELSFNGASELLNGHMNFQIFLWEREILLNNASELQMGTSELPNDPKKCH
jgi:hypothetical protein